MVVRIMDYTTLKLVVGSKNPVKINAAKNALQAFYPQAAIECIGIDAPSGVPDQPMNETETLEGALNRVKHCSNVERADFYLAMEGGVDNFPYGPATFAYVVISDGTTTSVGRSCNLPLPPAIFRALESGEELGPVMDRTFNTQNIKQQGGAIGLLTHGHATRESSYRQALTLAMAKFLHPELYTD